MRTKYKRFFTEMSPPNVSYIMSTIEKEIDASKMRSRSDRDMRPYHLAYKDYLQNYLEGEISPSDVAELSTKKFDIVNDSVESAQIQSALFIMKTVRKAIESIQVKRYRFFKENIKIKDTDNITQFTYRASSGKYEIPEEVENKLYKIIKKYGFDIHETHNNGTFVASYKGTTYRISNHLGKSNYRGDRLYMSIDYTCIWNLKTALEDTIENAEFNPDEEVW